MKYVLAVSGGVDSVVLLARAAQAKWRGQHLPDATWPRDFIVAHFDHGIRGEASHKDAQFVARLAQQYGVRFYLATADLTPQTSEAEARERRYQFLRSVCTQEHAELVTAHHLNDLVETMVINLIRGTGWRGIAPLGGAVRPLLSCPKFELICEALEHDLPWHEDQTNTSLHYLRNRVRYQLAGLGVGQRQAWLKLYRRQVKLKQEIEQLVADLVQRSVRRSDDELVLRRYDLIMWSDVVALEVLRRITAAQLTRPQLMELLQFARTAQPSKRHQVGKIRVRVTTKELYLVVQ